MNNIYESGRLPILQIPKSYNLSSYSLLLFLDVHSRDSLCLIPGTWTSKRETMTVLREDKSILGQDPCVSVQNSAPTPGKVVGGHDLSCGGSEFFVEWVKNFLLTGRINQLFHSSTAIFPPLSPAPIPYVSLLKGSSSSRDDCFRYRLYCRKWSIPTHSFHRIPLFLGTDSVDNRRRLSLDTLAAVDTRFQGQILVLLCFLRKAVHFFASSISYSPHIGQYICMNSCHLKPCTTMPK